MNDPHSYPNKVGGCGCSAECEEAKSETVASPDALMSCCSGASAAAMPAEQPPKAGGSCSGDKAPDGAAAVRTRFAE